MYIRSGMFSFGLTNFLSLSDRMSDMLKKFSTSLVFIMKKYPKSCLFMALLEYWFEFFFIGFIFYTSESWDLLYVYTMY